MFESSGAFALFDYFRVPHERVDVEPLAPGLASLSVRGETASLFWPLDAALTSERRRPSSYFLDATPLFGRVVPDGEVRSWLRRIGGKWRPSEDVRNEQGTPVGAVWRRDDGSTVLPFDPSELIQNFWSERYLDYVRPAAVSHLAGLARRGYYRARPLLPRSVQMSMRRSFSRVQSKSRFPRWPVETALHDFYDFLFATVAGVAERPIPFIGLWPRNWAWALVLTHDVEAQLGYEKLPELLRVEVEAGYRSSWNFVPRNRYVVADELVETLREHGFEVGVHGFNHDGRDLSSLATLQRRLPAIRDYAERWQAKGFRSPGTLRSAELMPLLGFDYDSSYTDTAPFEPQAGRFLRQRGGMALILTHSDYVGNPYLVDSYRRLLHEFADDSTAWKALPRDVSDWWRRRSNSSLEEVDGEWRVVGPAEREARVEFSSPHVLTA
jgi:peptidoglycan/xylan/chitin deacetylase (PgdA/CDA1 family)